MWRRLRLLERRDYVAPRHMRAIKAVGGDLRVALDPNDSIGIIDSYFPDASFFVEFERFDRHIDKLRHWGKKIDYVSICSPNYLHDAHCRFALRSDADAICEKPLVLNPWNIDGLSEIELESGRRISTIMQLRLHPAIQALKARIEASPQNEFSVDLTYIASRGRWYQTSWKGDEMKSGGVATNIGVHFFDALAHIFGPPVTISRICAIATAQQDSSFAGALRSAGSSQLIVTICLLAATVRQLIARSPWMMRKWNFPKDFPICTLSAMRKSWPGAALGSMRCAR